MLAPVALRTLVVLVSFPGLSHFGLRHHKAAARDTIPPVWKSASRLTLEDRFVRRSLLPLNNRRIALKVQPGMDPRHFVVDVEPDSGTITSGTKLGDTPVAPQATGSLREYSRQSTRETFEEVWKQNAIQHLNSLGAQTPSTTSRTGLSLQLPDVLPPRVKSFLGPGGPALNVSGSENISLSGTSSWTNQQTTLLGQSRSLFPSLDMQQNLDIRLEGQLSDRIKVNLLQNSANQIPLANRIAINYRGSEDDLVQQFDLGNTNLSLPGTQYVSYSGRNEGLFGLKSALRYGPLDVTMLASKQEGRSERSSYAGGASKQVLSIRDLEYIQGIYFTLYDPNGRTRVIDYNSLEVYKDDYGYANLANKVRGRAFLEPGRTLELAPDSVTADTSVRGWFKLLQRDADYDLLNDLRDDDHRYIRLHSAMAGEQTLAVTYSFRYADEPPGTVRREGVPSASLSLPDSAERWLKLIRSPASLLARDSTAQNFDNNYTRAPLNATRELELRNFYSLNGTNIDPRTFVLNIRRGFDDPPNRTFESPSGVPIPFVELLGLDSRTQADSLSSPTLGPDGRVDQAAINPHMRAFIDYTSGTLMFPDLRPFSPRLDVATHPFEASIDTPTFVRRRAVLNGAVSAENSPNLDIYEKYIVRTEMAQYFLDVEFTAQRATGEIYLGRSNIVDGSETVTINGQVLHRDKDYTIDYDLGRIKLIRQLGPADNLNVDYSYAPLFQQAGRTLLGGAFQIAGRDRGLGGAFIYESRGAQDLRPRLGEEPSRSLIADLNTNWAFKPQWMTRLADRLPGMRTTAPSDFNFQAEAGQSFPNPNTRNEVFVDDMEGARDAVSLTFDPSHWRLSSVPLRKVGTTNVELTDVVENVSHMGNAELHWFTPPAGFQERDLKPNLSDGQGAQNYHQTLALSIPKLPDPALGSRWASGDSLWAGLTYVLDPAGLDLSRSQFIELWVNDWRDRHDGVDEVPRVRDKHVKLHIDLGTVSEDQMMAPNKAPNHVFDPEDLNHDGVLQVTGDTPEDLGTDGKADAQEADVWDVSTSSPSDPHGDDFQTLTDTDTKHALDSNRYRFTNGTEGNHTLFPIPDTEDLNGNQTIDFDNNYVEFTVDLGDTAHLITDVYRDYRFFANNGAPIPADNGWRRYRIPLADSLRVIFGNPNLVFTRQVRLWIEGMTGSEQDAVNSPTPGSTSSAAAGC